MIHQEITLKSDPQNLNEVESFVRKFAKDYDINEDIYPNILISVTEAVNNAIIHGNKKNIDKEVQIILSSSQNKVEIAVSDEGKGFDPESVPDPTLAENIEKLGGRGVFLIQQLCDKVIFKNEGRTCVMEFFL